MSSLTFGNSSKEHGGRTQATVAVREQIDKGNTITNWKQKGPMSKTVTEATKGLEVKTPQSALPPFEFLESEIKFVGIIGEGQQAVVFRIACGGKTYACKIHKYEDLQVDIGIYPRPNTSFDREALAYTKTTQLQGVEIPRCYGYVEFTKIPQLEESKHENPYQQNGEFLPPYMKFAVGKEIFLQNNVKNWSNLLEYFQSAPDDARILRGIVLEEITNARSLLSSDLLFPRKLAESGIDTLKKLHRCGVLHRDLLNMENTLVVSGLDGERVVFLDFSLSETEKDFKPERFEEMARGEVEEWMFLFSRD